MVMMSPNQVIIIIFVNLCVFNSQLDTQQELAKRENSLIDAISNLKSDLKYVSNCRKLNCISFLEQ